MNEDDKEIVVEGTAVEAADMVGPAEAEKSLVEMDKADEQEDAAVDADFDEQIR